MKKLLLVMLLAASASVSAHTGFFKSEEHQSFHTICYYDVMGETLPLVIERGLCPLTHDFE